MNICLLLLASLASAIIPPPLSIDLQANTTLSPPQLGVSYRCATPDEHAPGIRMPSALDCLNIMTFILATTPRHDQPMSWSPYPLAGETMVPYKRESGSCQLCVRLARVVPEPKVEIATFDQMVGAALRVIEVCLLSYAPGRLNMGGLAHTGSTNNLVVMIEGTQVSKGSDGVLRNDTLTLNGPAAGIDQSYRS